MADTSTPSPAEIRAFEAENPNMRARDLAEFLGVREAQMVAAHVGRGTTRIAAHPDDIIPAAEALGEVMALTRVEACVHEKVGTYGNYRTGERACMCLTEEIDLRMFPSHWVHAYAVETQTDSGPKRSLQIFDAAGDAVHKIYLRAASTHDAWADLVAKLALEDQAEGEALAERTPTEAPKSRLEKVEELRAAWDKMTDTHQFLRICAQLKMNRLGAYRIVGVPYATRLTPEAGNDLLKAVRAQGFDVMIFVGNRGCIQIHTGPIGALKELGPWQNVMDPRFNMHLRLDHIAEVYAVKKPTQRGPALSVEAFDAEGGLIFQMFALGREDNDTRAQFREVVAGLPRLEEVSA